RRRREESLIFSNQSLVTSATTREDLLRQAFAELLETVEALFDVRHARRVADADVFVRAERDAGNHRHLFLFEQLRAKLSRAQAELRDVREEIKCAFRIHASDARTAV